MAANEVFSGEGRYVGPTGDVCVEIHKVKPGLVRYRFIHGVGEERSSSSPLPFKGSSDWFMCWDKYGRLWVYIPEQHGANCEYHFANGGGMGACRAGSADSWDGIPAAFLKRLPAEAKATYDRAMEHVGHGTGAPGSQSE